MARRKPPHAIKATKPAKAPKAKPTAAVYQLKITLLGIKPPIWRRIQVSDCTLDVLHEHIQAAMGWMNSHLHHFKLGENLYGDPLLMAENFEELGYRDSTRTRLSEIVPQGGKRFRFLYEYDFGDSWEHEVLVESYAPAESGRQYPMCLEGARACPPEDCGGVWGYGDFLEAIGNDKHEQKAGGHGRILQWPRAPGEGGVRVRP